MELLVFGEFQSWTSRSRKKKLNMLEQPGTLYKWLFGVPGNNMGVEPKIVGFSSKMDGENNGNHPYEQMDDFGGKPIIFGVDTHIP